jgi:hypothetical protein
VDFGSDNPENHFQIHQNNNGSDNPGNNYLVLQNELMQPILVDIIVNGFSSYNGGIEIGNYNNPVAFTPQYHLSEITHLQSTMLGVAAMRLANE